MSEAIPCRTLHIPVAIIWRFFDEHLLIYLELVIPQMLILRLYRLALMLFHLD